MAGTIVVDNIQSDSSYASTINVQSKINFTGGMQIGGQDATFAGMRNRLINGDMRIDQRYNGTANTPTDGSYVIDRWRAGMTQNSRYTIQRSDVAPTGFANSCCITVTSAATSGSTNQFGVNQLIEALNLKDLDWGTSAAKPVTVSFWVRSSVVGIYTLRLYGGSVGNSIIQPYTINQANTWEYKTLTFVGPTSGDIQNYFTSGLSVWFDFGSGSAYTSSTYNQWFYNTLMNRATGAADFIGTNGATFYLTGVQFEKGSTATPYEWRHYGTELALCQRYFYRLVHSQTQTWGYGHQQTTNLARITTQSPVVMRTTPAISTTATHYSISSGYGSSALSAFAVVDYSGTNIVVEATAPSVNGLLIAYGYAGYTQFSAEY